MDALGRFFSSSDEENGIGIYLFEELIETSQKLGFNFPVAKDFEFVAQPDGSPRGAYVLDEFGAQHTLNIFDVEGELPLPFELGTPPFWGFAIAKDLEIAPDWRTATHGFGGYFVLDGYGAVHPVGFTNNPVYAYFPPNSPTDDIENADFAITPFPETINVSGSTIFDATGLLLYGPLNIPVNRPFTANQIVESVTPVFTYFGWDIARDLEVSADSVTITIPSRTATGPVANRPYAPRKIAMTNGYYILDGFGAVHSARLPLDFDTNGDGRILYDDLYSDFENEIINEDFGNPINNVVLSAPWYSDRENLPYFGPSDIAVDIEITPTGRGFYMLDKFGGLFAVGDATFVFPPKYDDQMNPVKTPSSTPYLGFPIAQDLTLVTNEANPELGAPENMAVVGLIVLDGFGLVHTAGHAESFMVSETGDEGYPIYTTVNIFRDAETTPVWRNETPPVRGFVVNDQVYPVSVAPGFRNVTAAYTSVSAPQ
ncbi:MAG: hypothetical protein ACOX5R_09115 [bacterium]